jgi:hypothetical protein
MQNLLTLLFLFSCHVTAAEWVVTEGGLSPDGKLAVAVYPQKSEFVDETDDTVLLIDHSKARIIGPLEEVSSSGGIWGKTTTNVYCIWSTDGDILVVNFRTGRLMHSSQIYRVRDHRAIPLELPASKTHPKGILLEGIDTTVNPGEEVSMTTDGAILRRVWGYVPDWDLDYAKHVLKDFEGELLFHYCFDQQGRIQLKDITVPKRH